MKITHFDADYSDPLGFGCRMSGGRIFAASALPQLQAYSSGFAWDGTSTSDGQYWDDAGYWQPYGARDGEWFDPAAVVAIVPVAGRYRYTFQSAQPCSATVPLVGNEGPNVSVVIETDPVPSGAWYWERMVVATLVSGVYRWAAGIEVVAWLDAGGCMGVETGIGALDTLSVNSYQTIEKIG
jgi:hypothetical protein